MRNRVFADVTNKLVISYFFKTNLASTNCTFLLSSLSWQQSCVDWVASGNGWNECFFRPYSVSFLTMVYRYTINPSLRWWRKVPGSAGFFYETREQLCPDTLPAGKGDFYRRQTQVLWLYKLPAITTKPWLLPLTHSFTLNV